MARKCYFAVCYGHVCRWAHAETPAAAVYDAFGVRVNAFDAARITVGKFPGNPKYMPHKVRRPFLEVLFQRHKEKTGVEIK